jgi:hypothetical protein
MENVGTEGIFFKWLTAYICFRIVDQGSLSITFSPFKQGS